MGKNKGSRTEGWSLCKARNAPNTACPWPPVQLCSALVFLREQRHKGPALQRQYCGVVSPTDFGNSYQTEFRSQPYSFKGPQASDTPPPPPPSVPRVPHLEGGVRGIHLPSCLQGSMRSMRMGPLRLGGATIFLSLGCPPAAPRAPGGTEDPPWGKRNAALPARDCEGILVPPPGDLGKSLPPSTFWTSTSRL